MLYKTYLKNGSYQPWLVWLSGLSASLQTKGSPVQFPVRAHTWVAGQVSSRGGVGGNHTWMFLSLCFKKQKKWQLLLVVLIPDGVVLNSINLYFLKEQNLCLFSGESTMRQAHSYMDGRCTILYTSQQQIKTFFSTKLNVFYEKIQYNMDDTIQELEIKPLEMQPLLVIPSIEN